LYDTPPIGTVFATCARAHARCEAVPTMRLECPAMGLAGSTIDATVGRALWCHGGRLSILGPARAVCIDS